MAQVDQLLNRGERVAVTGSRGSGKTTLLQTVCRKRRVDFTHDERNFSNFRLLEVENPLQAILLRDQNLEISFLHLEELPEDAVRSVMKGQRQHGNPDALCS
jgi:ABC-type phosphate/phosphonate transport system ATPase subunit